MSRLTRIALALGATAMLASVGTPAHAETAAPQPTIVTFTFDDTLISQKAALDVLAENGMTGTAYVNSPRINKDTDYLTLDQLKAYQAGGFEIGGHTLDHPDLTTLTTEQMQHQICDDRATLLDMGLNVTDFAYPLGAEDAQVEEVAKSCGYNSARTLPGLRSPGYGCVEDCPTAETIPPANLYAIRTPTTIRPSTTLEMMETYVTQAEEDQGGWVPLVFHHICESACSTVDDSEDNSISLEHFKEFVEWLAQRPSTTSVQTVADVIGGTVQPSVGTVQDHSVTEAAPKEVAPPSASADGDHVIVASQHAAFTVVGIKVNQTLIMSVGLLLALSVIITYRLASKGSRYVDGANK